ncbi:hypothetical protein [Prescottella agglutinans]|uniref:hypothetical protein n=1 Tax=Prescottella agglutinans TaxID=1644129 RepID=UPI0024741475|nr:hypothetical protein [Prescottella agglutinans]
MTVPTDTVIYAVRYCMGRLTYANGDARALLRATWKDLPGRDQVVILRDIDSYLKDVESGLFTRSAELVREWSRLRYELGGTQ